MDKFSPLEIEEMAEHLQKGHVVLYPTQTIWALGCNALDETALQRLVKIKKRQDNKPFILLVDSIEMLEEYVPKIQPKAVDLIQYFERPLTILHHANQSLPALLIGEDGMTAFRVTKDPFCKAFIRLFGKPVISSSANISGQSYPKSFAEIDSTLLEQVDYIPKHKRKTKSEYPPSAIVRIDEKDELVFIRR